MNTITWLASPNKNVIKSGIADREYDKVVGKYRDAPSMVGRLKGVDGNMSKSLSVATPLPRTTTTREKNKRDD